MQFFLLLITILIAHACIHLEQHFKVMVSLTPPPFSVVITYLSIYHFLQAQIQLSIDRTLEKALLQG